MSFSTFNSYPTISAKKGSLKAYQLEVLLLASIFKSPKIKFIPDSEQQLSGKSDSRESASNFGKSDKWSIMREQELKVG